MKEKEKRSPRSYKARQTPYKKASRRAKSSNTTLAEVIEILVFAYADPSCEILIKQDKLARSVDAFMLDMDDKK